MPRASMAFQSIFTARSAASHFFLDFRSIGRRQNDVVERRIRSYAEIPQRPRHDLLEYGRRDGTAVVLPGRWLVDHHGHDQARRRRGSETDESGNVLVRRVDGT